MSFDEELASETVEDSASATDNSNYLEIYGFGKTDEVGHTIIVSSIVYIFKIILGYGGTTFYRPACLDFIMVSLFALVYSHLVSTSRYSSKL